MALFMLKKHLNDNHKIIDATKIWTDADLESSMLVEVPKENLNKEPSPPIIDQINNKEDNPLNADRSKSISLICK